MTHALLTYETRSKAKPAQYYQQQDTEDQLNQRPVGRPEQAEIVYNDEIKAPKLRESSRASNEAL